MVIALALVSLLLSHLSGAQEPPEDPGPRPCPIWLEDAPRLGPGRPEAISRKHLESVTVCRYYENPNLANGPDLPPNDKLANEKTISVSRTVQSLARSIDRLRSYPAPKNGTPFCSAEFGGGFWVNFGYFDGREASVEVVPSGCPRAVAGKHGGWLMLSGKLRQRLRKIAPLPRQGG